MMPSSFFHRYLCSTTVVLLLLHISCTVATPRILMQSDFTNGTFRIVSPGKYVFGEDIVFNPNPGRKNEAGAWMPNRSQYPGPQFSLGFFAAITIEAPDVVLNLKGHTLKVSNEFYLQQRFHALISLTSVPFIPGQGPSHFGEVISATNCVVKNGVLGRTPHHGIHGNNVNGCKIKNLIIENFEVAGISLNNASNIVISHVTVRNSLRDVPVNGAYNSGRFLLMFFRQYSQSFLNTNSVSFVGGRTLTLQEIIDRLEEAMNLMFDFFIHGNQSVLTHPLWGEFVNRKGLPTEGLPDGSAMYGIAINGVGEAAGGLGKSQISSHDVTIRDVKVKHLTLAVKEVVKYFEKDGGNGIPAQGATGGTFNIVEVSDNQFADPASAQYVGTTLSDAQIAFKLFSSPSDALISKPLKIPQSIVDWATIGTPLSPSSHDLKCNGDDQFHVNKGVFGIRIDATNNFTISKTKIRDIESKSDLGSNLCGAYNVSHPKQTLLGFRGGVAFGLSLFTSTGKVKKTKIKNIESLNGIANGIKIFDAAVAFKKKNSVKNVIVESDSDNSSPNPDPTACGVCLAGNANYVTGTNETLALKCIDAENLCSPSGNMLSFGTVEQCKSDDDL